MFAALGWPLALALLKRFWLPLTIGAALIAGATYFYAKGRSHESAAQVKREQRAINVKEKVKAKVESRTPDENRKRLQRWAR
ncbi:MAG: hypothetical protein AB7S41_11355 [Parvibaculaceae bacterium]